KELDILHEPCSMKENKTFKELRNKKENLPEGVYKYDNSDSYYRLAKTDLSSEELNNLMMYRQTSYLRTIKNSMVFFVFLTIASILVWLFFAFNY
ncbi:hypothetical protein, partial [Vallitalea sediminicola]